MGSAVTIKGTKSGIILVLDPSISFDSLKAFVADKFKEASSFLGKNSQGLVIRGRKLSESETQEIITVIEENSNLKIICVIDDESDYEAYIAAKLNPEPVEAEPDIVFEVSEEDYVNNAMIHRGNLRSGQDISSNKSVIVLGDVKPGATVTSQGSIFILGELRGNAFAGSSGDKKSVIMALDLDPIQLRIAETIAISPDAEKGAKIKVRRKSFLKNTDNDPEVAYIENNRIVKTTYGSSFLRQFYKK